MEYPVHVESLTKRYGRNVAVSNVSLAVRPGEIYALIGPNGAGKSTTIDILTGFQTFDEGRVRVLGEAPLKAGRAWRDQVGIVPQFPGTFDDLTVLEIVRHFALLYSHAKSPAEVLGSVGLESIAGQVCRTLSGGQRRRVDIALAIVGSPEVLFLDEPTTGLDPQARRQLWALIESLSGAGTTIILTTHYLDEAEHLADRIGVICNGRMLAEGTAAEIRGRQATEATVSFCSEGLDITDLPGGERVSTVAGVTSVVTTAPTATVAAWSCWADRVGLSELPELVVERPSLETVYLGLLQSELRSAS